MKIIFPSNCINEANKYGYLIKLNRVFIDWHNTETISMTPNEQGVWVKSNLIPRLNIIGYDMGQVVKIAEIGSYWNPRVPGHVSGGNINYPASLNLSNKGSKGVFLIGLRYKLRNHSLDDVDVLAIDNAIAETKQEAVMDDYWTPSLEDIVNV